MAKIGRPTKYNEDYHPKTALKLSLAGFTDDQMADFFEINPDTLYEWKKRYPAFSEALKNGKAVADANVASTLYQRAMGTTKKIKKAIKIREQKNGEGMVEKIEHVEDEIYIPPDVTAIIFWLKNRQPRIWRDRVEQETTIKGSISPDKWIREMLDEVEDKDTETVR